MSQKILGRKKKIALRQAQDKLIAGSVERIGN